MNLLSFKIKHFRCLFDVQFIPFKDLTIFTGENDGGKSTTLLALEIFLDPRKKPNTDDYSYTLSAAALGENMEQEMDIEMSAEFALLPAETALLELAWNIGEANITISRFFKLGEVTSAYLISAQRFNDNFFQKSLSDYTIAILQENAQRLGIDLRARRGKQEIIDAINEWHELQPKVSAHVELPRSLVERLPIIQIFSSETALDPQMEITRVLQSRFSDLLNKEEHIKKISEITTVVEEDLNREVEELLPFVKRYSREIENISIRPSFNFAHGLTTTDLQVVKKGNIPVLLENSGTGQRRRLSLAIYEWSGEIYKDRTENSRQLILAFDEPETHLDYSSQRQIFDTIKEFAKRPAIQVIVCTHSPNFIERVSIENIVHFTLTKFSGSTSIQTLRINDHETAQLFLYKISENLGMRNSVLLHERCFLVVEGQTEMGLIPIIFQKKYNMQLQSAGICLINGYGNFGAIMLVRFLKQNRRAFLVLVDTDSNLPGSTVRQYFTQASIAQHGIHRYQVYYAGTKELEDAFTDDLWVQMLEQNYPKHSGLPWQLADIAPLRVLPKFSSALIDLIKNEANLPNNPSKIELGIKLAESITDVADCPSVQMTCLEHAFRKGKK